MDHPLELRAIDALLGTGAASKGVRVHVRTYGNKRYHTFRCPGRSGRMNFSDAQQHARNLGVTDQPVFDNVKRAPSFSSTIKRLIVKDAGWVEDRATYARPIRNRATLKKY